MRWHQELWNDLLYHILLSKIQDCHFENMKIHEISCLRCLSLRIHKMKPWQAFRTSDTALESWRSIFFDEKVFYPPQKFFTPFFTPHASHVEKKSKTRFFDQTWMMKKGGKKLLRGAKNFWVWKRCFSALICTINHYYSFLNDYSK